MKHLQLIYAFILIIGIVCAFGVVVYEQFKRPKKTNGKKRLNKYQIGYKGQIYTVPKDIHALFLEQMRENEMLQTENTHLKSKLNY